MLRPKPFFNAYGAFYKAHAGQKKINVDQVRRYFRKTTLVVVKRTLSNSAPCRHCVELIRKYGIRKVYYSRDKELVYEKASELSMSHTSAKYKRPWREWKEQEKQKLNEKLDQKIAENPRCRKKIK